MLIEIPRLPTLSQTVGVEVEPVRLPLAASYRTVANLGAAFAYAAYATFFSFFAASPILVKFSRCATVWDYTFLPILASVFGAFAILHWLSAAAFARYAFTSGTVLTTTDVGVSIGRLGAYVEWSDVVQAELHTPGLLLTLRSRPPQENRSTIGYLSERALDVQYFIRESKWPKSNQVFLARGYFDVSSWRLAHVVALFVAKAGGDVDFSQPRAHVITAPVR